MREENLQNRDFMLHFVINIMEEAMDFSWSTAKASHAVLLCNMEQGEIECWHQVEKIDRVRHCHTPRHTSGQVQTRS